MAFLNAVGRIDPRSTQAGLQQVLNNRAFRDATGVRLQREERNATPTTNKSGADFLPQTTRQAPTVQVGVQTPAPAPVVQGEELAREVVTPTEKARRVESPRIQRLRGAQLEQLAAIKEQRRIATLPPAERDAANNAIRLSGFEAQKQAQLDQLAAIKEQRRLASRTPKQVFEELAAREAAARQAVPAATTPVGPAGTSAIADSGDTGAPATASVRPAPTVALKQVSQAPDAAAGVVTEQAPVSAKMRTSEIGRTRPPRGASRTIMSAEMRTMLADRASLVEQMEFNRRAGGFGDTTQVRAKIREYDAALTNMAFQQGITAFEAGDNPALLSALLTRHTGQKVVIGKNSDGTWYKREGGELTDVSTTKGKLLGTYRQLASSEYAKGIQQAKVTIAIESAKSAMKLKVDVILQSLKNKGKTETARILTSKGMVPDGNGTGGYYQIGGQWFHGGPAVGNDLNGEPKTGFEQVPVGDAGIVAQLNATTTDSQAALFSKFSSITGLGAQN